MDRLVTVYIHNEIAATNLILILRLRFLRKRAP